MKTIQMISLLTTKIRSLFQRWGAWLPLTAILTIFPFGMKAQPYLMYVHETVGNLGEVFLYNVGTCIYFLPDGTPIPPQGLFFCGGFVWAKVPASGTVGTPIGPVTIEAGQAVDVAVWAPGCQPDLPPDPPDGPPPGCGGGGGGSDPCQQPQPPGCKGSCPSCSSPNNGCGGMPVWSVSQPYTSLWLHDEPMSYQPSVGPKVSLHLAFKQREWNSGFYANHFSMGKRWNFSWLSYITLDENGTNVLFMPGGGQVTFNTTNDYLSNAQLSGDTTNGFTVTYPNGSEDIYGLITTNTSGGFVSAYMTEKLDPQSNVTTLVYYPYDPTNDVIRLEYVIDADGRTNFIYYATNNAYSTNLIAAVVDPFGRTVSMAYDPNGCLTNLTDVNANSTAFTYSDDFGTISNMTTPYGTTTFSMSDSGDPNVLDGRSVLVTQPDGGRQLYLYSQSPPGFLNSYPSSQIPQTPFPNTFDTELNQNDSFYWGPRQYAALSTTNIQAFTRNDYLKARMSHWLLNSDGVPSKTLGASRDPSPDSAGTIEGMKTWYDYAGKTNAEYEGTQIMPWLVAHVLPDGTTSFTRTDRNPWSFVTNEISTYSANGVVALRTNTYVYAENGIDCMATFNAIGVLVSSNVYNADHQVLTNYDALNEMTTYTYDSSNRLTSTTMPNGLVTTNIYGSDGYLAEDIVVGICTNYYTYTNALVYTHIDPRGLTTTNTWDNLNRLTSTIYPDGSYVSNQYTFLDLTGTRDRMGNWTSYGYDSMRRKIVETNANGAVTHYNYCTCGSLESMEDALGNMTYYYYDNQGELTNTVCADGYSVSQTYDSMERVVTICDSGGDSNTNIYNNQGLITASRNSYGLIQSSAYDVLDRITNAVDQNGVTVNAIYDELNRPLTISYPDGGTESWGYTLNISSATSFTNQTGNVTLYGFDQLGRTTNEVAAGISTNSFIVDGGNDLVAMTDGKNQTEFWHYDSYGRQTNMVDTAGNVDYICEYDADNRVTNRWTPAKGHTTYAYDAVGNLTRVNYPTSPSVTLIYDPLDRFTNMLDGVGATVFSYDAAGQLLSEGGLWPNDTVSYTYSNRRRISLNLAQINGGAWIEGYGYDLMGRLTGVTSPAGTFNYSYNASWPSRLPVGLSLPNGAFITNTYNGNAMLLSTALKNSSGMSLDSYVYAYNQANRRVSATRTAGDYINYGYDNAGQVTSASGNEGNGQSRLQEQFGYAYDAAGNLNFRTNNALVQAFNVNNLNELTTATNSGTLTVAGAVTPIATNVTVNSLNAYLYNDNTFARDGFVPTNGLNIFTAIAEDAYGRTDTNTVTVNLPATNSYAYDLNGNLVSDGTRNFAYDDNNELIAIWVSNAWSNSIVYDGLGAKRIERDYTFQAGGWAQTNETHYIYDENAVIEERDTNNNPLVRYTRGNDLSSSPHNAGGIGGLLARTSYKQGVSSSSTTAFYHADGNGNITALIYPNQQLAAKYLYDPFGNILAMSGPLAAANKYRFSSKEWNDNSGLYCYFYRYYDPNLQRWLNRDPMAEFGGFDLYRFCDNDPVGSCDPLGLETRWEEQQVAIGFHEKLVGYTPWITVGYTSESISPCMCAFFEYQMRWGLYQETSFLGETKWEEERSWAYEIVPTVGGIVDAVSEFVFSTEDAALAAAEAVINYVKEYPKEAELEVMLENTGWQEVPGTRTTEIDPRLGMVTDGPPQPEGNAERQAIIENRPCNCPPTGDPWKRNPSNWNNNLSN